MMFFKILKRHVRKNIIFIILFLLCQTVSVLSANFVVSYVSARNEYNNQFNEIIRTVEISSSHENDNAVDSIKLVNEQYKDVVEKCYAWTTYNGYAIKVNLTGYVEADTYISVGNYLSNQSEFECVINPMLGTEFNDVIVGDSITIHGVQYTIVGMYPYDYIEIPYSTHIAELRIEKIEVVFDYNADTQKVKSCLTLIQTNFTDTSLPEIQHFNHISLDIYEIALVLLILVVINLNFCSLYLYVIDEDSEILSVFKVLGAPLSRVKRWFIVEVICLSLFGMSVATLFFQMFVAHILSNVNLGLNFVLSMDKMVIVALVQIISICIVFVPMLNKRYKDVKAV